jgi:protein-S-isoprenylcysteine O-methyltransferase Ste14
MVHRGFLSRHGIVRNAIREDMLFFALPALLVFFIGLVVSTRDGYDGLVSTLWDLVRQSRSFRDLSVPNIVGLSLFVAGLIVAIIAVGTLGRFYSSTLVTRQEHKLITHGLYRYTRHPIYLCVLTICIGMPVYASSVAGFLTMSALIPIFLNRIRIEERMLTEEFGDAYRSYRVATSKLIPFIY